MKVLPRSHLTYPCLAWRPAFENPKPVDAPHEFKNIKPSSKLLNFLPTKDGTGALSFSLLLSFLFLIGTSLFSVSDSDEELDEYIVNSICDIMKGLLENTLIKRKDKYNLES